MILALVDDLMFRSKIKSIAAQRGVPVTFVQSSDAALAEMRAKTPALVIFDLNNQRTDPLGTLAAMRNDAALASIPTIGYVSHVDVDTINAARAAGAGEVLARSAFAAKLAELLANPAPDRS
jgi:PleD family two-component response regulator